MIKLWSVCAWLRWFRRVCVRVHAWEGVCVCVCVCVCVRVCVRGWVGGCLSTVYP